jgi:hypothetical protein
MRPATIINTTPSNSDLGKASPRAKPLTSNLGKTEQFKGTMR